MTKGSKKGSSFEREIVKQLSLWWSANKREDIFYRTSGSGSRATTRSKQNKSTVNSYGDVGYLDPIGKPFIDFFLIEIKRGYTKEIDVLSFLDKAENEKDPILYQWYLKAAIERAESNRVEEFIIFKRDRKKICIMITENFYSKIKEVLYGSFILKVNMFCFILFDDFIKYVKPNKLKGIIKANELKGINKA